MPSSCNFHRYTSVHKCPWQRIFPHQLSIYKAMFLGYTGSASSSLSYYTSLHSWLTNSYHCKASLTGNKLFFSHTRLNCIAYASSCSFAFIDSNVALTRLPSASAGFLAGSFRIYYAIIPGSGQCNGEKQSKQKNLHG